MVAVVKNLDPLLPKTPLVKLRRAGRETVRWVLPAITEIQTLHGTIQSEHVQRSTLHSHLMVAAGQTQTPQWSTAPQLKAGREPVRSKPAVITEIQTLHGIIQSQHVQHLTVHSF